MAKKRSYSKPLQVAAAGIYPGFAPLRVKLIDASDSSDDGGDTSAWDRAVEIAESSAMALRQRLIQATSSLVAPQETYSLFRPAEILMEGERLHLVDGEGKSHPGQRLPRGWVGPAWGSSSRSGWRGLRTRSLWRGGDGIGAARRRASGRCPADWLAGGEGWEGGNGGEGGRGRAQDADS